MKNWWYYHKWYVICGIILLFIFCNLIGNALGLWKKAPDFQVAYIGKSALPQDTVSKLKETFTSIGGDFNNDGEVLVEINQYLDGAKTSDGDSAYYEYGSEITLIGDITDCESYFFLMEDPENFQKEFHVLASADGSCPDDLDFSVDDKVLPWTECPGLSKIDLGTGSELFVGRRCFYTEKTTAHVEECEHLWGVMTGTSSSSNLSDSSVKIGRNLEVKNTNSQLTLLDAKDVLAADGLYYATWVSGDSEPYENSEGETVDLYDAQLYLLLGEAKNQEEASQNMSTWIAAAKENYEILTEEEVTYNSQTYSLLTYNFKNADAPYQRGVSAFGTFNNCAICIELTCREDYEMDLQTILTQFLEDCFYSSR